jgi:23S rRNA pseudouridine2605 synthase
VIRSAKTARPAVEKAVRNKPGRAAPAAERLQKWLAATGAGSRRQIEGWIRAGRVTVDGKQASLGQKVTGRERIAVNGRAVRATPRHRQAISRVLIYHKPIGEVCTRSDPQGRPTVFDSLPPLHGSRWVVVGRLDIDTSGLLIFTTDGALAHALMHPSGEMVREYAVRLRGAPQQADIDRLLAGVALDDGVGRFSEVSVEGGSGSNHWYRVSVSEGRNRIVRRLWEAVGCQVSRLIRVRFGPLALPRHLPRGRYRELIGEDQGELYRAVGLPLPERLTRR